MKRRDFLKAAAIAAPTLLLPRKVSGQFGFRSPAFVGGLNQPGGGAAQTWILKETFETATTGYDNAQGVTFLTEGTVDPASNTVALQGAQSCKITFTSASGDVLTYPAFTAQDTLYSYFMFRITQLPTTISVLYTVQNGADIIGRIYLLSDGRLGARNGNGTVGYTTSTVAINTTYHVFYRYSAGTGTDNSSTNGFSSVGFSTDGTNPTSGSPAYNECVDGTRTLQANIAVCFGQKDGTGGTVYFDKWYMSPTAIASNP